MQLKLSEIFESYTNQKNISNQDKSNIKTALFRYTLPELGYIIPQRSKKRLHPGDVELAVRFCDDIYANSETRKELTKLQENCFIEKNLSGTLVRHNKKVLKDFLDYTHKAVKQEELPVKEKKEYRLAKIKVADYSHVEAAKPRKKQKAKIALSFDIKDYPDNTFTAKKELNRIKSELVELEKFLHTLQDSQKSRESTLRYINLMIGWQYKKVQDLTQVGIYKLVIKYNIYPKRNNQDYIEYMASKAEAIDQSKDYAKDTIRFIENFFEEYQVKTRASKMHYLKCFIVIAKFLYKDITDKEENSNYEDISVIKRLRILSNNIPKDSQKIEPKLPDWEIIIKCVKELKVRTDLKYFNKGRHILKKDRAFRLQKFLVLAFFTFMPPARQRVIRELKLGETLKYGDYIDSVFIPYEQLENKTEAKFFIHLLKYKTQKTYGEWLGEVPNHSFDDGTDFYSYLNSWINEYREVMLNGKPDHGFLFMGSKAKKPMDVDNMCYYIVGIFDSTIGLKLSPHKLRNIYCTYLADSNADQQTIASSAYWMRHSPEMARKVYTKQSIENKLRPGAERITAINSKFL